MPLHHHTPVFRTAADYSCSNRPLLLKMDAFQPAGSFKLRGLGLRCERDVAAGIASFVCASGGNAGFAAAYAAARLSARIIIVVPETTTDQAREAIRRTGADLQVHGASFDDANVYARQIAQRDNSIGYLHPYDDPILWEGHATLVDEVVADGYEFDCIVLSVGGGGLLAGVAEGLLRNGMDHIPIIAVETFGADCLAASLEAGERVTLPAITSIATSLGAKTVAEHVFALAKQRQIISVRVSDGDAVRACLKLGSAHRVLVEPACGAALAALDVFPDLFAMYRRPLIEVCGGIGVSLPLLTLWSEQTGVELGQAF